MFSKKPFEHEDSSAFIRHCRNGDPDSVAAMLKNNKFLVYDFDWTGQTCLHWACKRGHKEIVELLLRAGAYIDAEDLVSDSQWEAIIAFVREHEHH